MDWFERLTGFRETSYDDTRRRLEIDGGRLRSRVNGKSYAIGELELVSVKDLRERVRAANGPGLPLESLWTMRNGYALCSRAGLDAIANHLEASTPDQIDALRGMLRIGVHRQVEVTDGEPAHSLLVSQAFCSALPVAYSLVPAVHWQAFASLVLESAYEATLWAAVDNAQRGGSNVVLLTRLGGGAFGNDDEWIDAAMRRAIQTRRGPGS